MRRDLISLGNIGPFFCPSGILGTPLRFVCDHNAFVLLVFACGLSVHKQSKTFRYYSFNKQFLFSFPYVVGTKDACAYIKVKGVCNIHTRLTLKSTVSQREMSGWPWAPCGE